MFRLACGDVMPGCPARFEARSPETLLEQVAAHASSAHDLHTIDDDTRAAIAARIQRTA